MNTAFALVSSVVCCTLQTQHQHSTFHIAHRPNAPTMALANHFFSIPLRLHVIIRLFLDIYISANLDERYFCHCGISNILSCGFFIAYIHINNPTKHFTQNCDSCSFHHAYFHLTWNFVLSSRFLICHIHVNVNASHE